MSYTLEHQKKTPMHFFWCVVSVTTVPLLPSIFEDNTGATGHWRINRTYMQPCPAWGWVTVFKLQLWAEHKFRNRETTIRLGIPKRTHTHPWTSLEIMYVRGFGLWQAWVCIFILLFSSWLVLVKLWNLIDSTPIWTRGIPKLKGRN